MNAYLDNRYEFVSDGEKDYYRRLSDSKSSIKGEFLNILNDITGDTDLANYTAEKSSEKSIEKERCICSKIIKELCYIKHKKTNTIIQVGNECILKLNKNLSKGLKNGVCKVCKTGLTDMRNKWCKDGYCSLNCQTICACGNRKGWSSVIKSYYPLCFRCYNK